MKEGNGWDSIILVIDRIQDGSMNTGQKKSWLVVSSQDSFRLYLVSVEGYSLGMG